MKLSIPIPSLKHKIVSKVYQQINYNGPVLNESLGKCWVWTGSTYRNGYGRIRIHGNSYSTHRLLYYLHNGIDPMNMLVCHKCDNKLCCNPNHLFVGSHIDNARDSIDKGKFFRSRNPETGRIEKTPLTEEQEWDKYHN
jgi:HNH endonuclease